MTDKRLTADYERARGYLDKADEYAQDLEKYGYGVVLSYASLALAHLRMIEAARLIDGPGSPQWTAECEEFGCHD